MPQRQPVPATCEHSATLSAGERQLPPPPLPLPEGTIAFCRAIATTATTATTATSSSASSAYAAPIATATATASRQPRHSNRQQYRVRVVFFVVERSRRDEPPRAAVARRAVARRREARHGPPCLLHVHGRRARQRRGRQERHTATTTTTTTTTTTATTATTTTTATTATTATAATTRVHLARLLLHRLARGLARGGRACLQLRDAAVV